MDRALPFPGWTTPGVFTLGAAQIALKAQGVAIGRRVALVGAGPLLPLVTYQYLKAGANVVAALDLTPLPPKVRALPGLLAEPATLLKGLLAFTPVAALMFRFNNPDALLVAMMTAGAYCLIRALEHAGTRWILAAGR